MLDIALEQAGALSILKLSGSMEPIDIGVLSAYFGAGQDIHLVDILEVGQLMPEGGEILIRAARKSKRREGQLILVTAVSESETDKILAIQGASREFVCYSAREQAVRSAEALQRERFTKSIGTGKLSSKLHANTEDHAPTAPAEKQCPNCKAKVSPAADRCYLCGMLLSDRETMMFHKPEFEQCPSCHANMLIHSDECPLCGYTRPKPLEEAPVPVKAVAPATGRDIPASQSSTREAELSGSKVPAAVVAELDDPARANDSVNLENAKNALAAVLHELMELEARRSVMLHEISDIEMKRHEVEGRLSEQEKAALDRIEELKNQSESLSASVSYLESRRSQTEEELRNLDSRTDAVKQEISARAATEGVAEITEQQAVFSKLEAGKAEAEALRVEVGALALRRQQMQQEIEESRETATKVRIKALEEIEADRRRLDEERAAVQLEKDNVAESAREIQRQFEEAHASTEASRQDVSQQMLSEYWLSSAAETLRAEIDQLRKEQAQGIADTQARQTQGERAGAESAARFDSERAEMERMEAERNAVHADIEMHRQQAETLRADLRGLEEERDEAQSRQQARAVALREEIAGLVDERAHVEREIERFKGQLEKEMRQASVAVEAQQTERSGLEVMRTEAEAARTEAEAMRTQTEAMRAEVDGLAARRAEICAEIEAYAADARANSAALEETSSLRAREEEKLNLAHTELSKFQDQISSLREDIAGVGEEKNRILEKKAQALGELAGIMEKSQTTRDSLSEEIASTQSRRDALAAEAETLHYELTALAAEKDDAGSHLSALKQEIDTAQRTREQVHSEAAAPGGQALQAESELLSRMIEEQKAALASLRTDAANLDENIAVMKDEKDALEHDRALIMQAVADSNQSLASERSNLADIEEKKIALAAENHALRAEIQAAEERKSAAVEQEQLATGERDHLREDGQKLHVEIGEARELLRSLNDEGKRIYEDVQSIKREYADAEKDRASVERELANVRRELNQAVAALADQQAQSHGVIPEAGAKAAAESDAERGEMRARLDEALGARDEALQKYNAAAAELELLKMRTASAQDPRRDMVEALQEERKVLADGIEMLRKERDTVRKEKDFELRTMEILKREIGRWMRERVKISSEKDAELIMMMRSEIDQLRAEKNESPAASGAPAFEPSQFVAVTEIKRLRDELLEVKAQNDSLERAGQKLEVEKRALAEAASEAQRDQSSGSYRPQSDLLLHEKAALEAAGRDAATRLEAIAGEKRAMEAEYAAHRDAAVEEKHRLGAALDEMRLRTLRETADREESERKITEMKSRIDEQTASRMELEALLNELRTEAEGKDAAARKATALEEELKRVRADLEASAESELRAVELMQELVEERDELARKLEKTGIAAEGLKYAEDVPKLRKSVAEAANERDRMLAEQQAVLNSFKEAVAEREKQIEDMNRKTEAASEQLKSVSTECEILESRRDELAADISRLNDELEYYEKKRNRMVADAAVAETRFAAGANLDAATADALAPVARPRATPAGRGLAGESDQTVSAPMKWADKAPSRPISAPTKWPDKEPKRREPPDDAVHDLPAAEAEVPPTSDDVDALMLKAYTLEDAGYSNDAIKLYNTIIAMDPQNIRAMHNLALLKYRSGDIDSASHMLELLVAGTRNVPMETRKLLMEIDRHRTRPSAGWKNIFGRRSG